jgi:signal transduction histidine kinase
MTGEPARGTTRPSNTVAPSAIAAPDDNREIESFEALLEEFAEAFVGVPSPEIDIEIERWLRRICEIFNADRGTLAQFTSEGLVATHAWARPGFELTTGIRGAAVPWLVAKYQRGEMFSFSSLDEIPTEASDERHMFRSLRLKSHVSAPLMVAGSVFGALGIGCMRESRQWPADVLQRFRLIGTVLANALARKRAGQEYLQLSRALAHAGRVAAMGQLAASFAHEINQPLGASMTNAQSALRLLNAPEPDLGEIRRALDDIVADSHRAGEIVREQRRFLRRQEPSLTTIAVAELLEAVVRFVSAEARSQSVAIKIDLAGGLPDIRADQVQIQQVLVNLLLNAFDALSAMPVGQRRIVIAAARAPENCVMLSVADSGPGVPAHLRESLFEPFVTTKSNGLGIGLAIAQTIMVAHGSRLEYTDRPGGGAVFTFSLPLAAHESDGT